MAPIPSDNTGVVFLDYLTCQENHTVQCRYGASSSPADAMTALDAWLTALGNSHFVMNVTGARNRDLGSNITTDLTWTGADSYGAGGGTHAASAQFYDFVGRDAAGVRLRLALFGAIILTEGTDYRAVPGDDAAFAAALAVLNAASDVFITVGGGQPIWKQYVNLGVNAYWRNKIR